MINGKVYIGQDAFGRADYFGSGKLIKRAIDKYGKNNFVKEIIEECDDKHILNEREKFWIKYYDSTNTSIGYNIRLGGEGIAPGTKLNDSHRDSIKEASIRNWEDEKYREKMKKLNEERIVNKTGIYSSSSVSKAAESRRGRKHSEETIQLFKAQRQGVYEGEKNPMYGTSFYEIWVEKFGKEEAEKRKAEVYANRKTYRGGYYQRWIEKFGKEEADRRKDALYEKRKRTLADKKK
jgi:group I intron endonuclease